VKRALLALLALLALQELALRIVFPLPEVLNFDRHAYSPLDPTPRAEHPGSLAHASYLWASDPDGFAYEHRLNLYGFRDREWRLEPAPGERRVAFVGDSFVEGFSADAESALPAAFAARARAAGLRVEALNLGVAGAGLASYARLLRDALPLLRPQDVLLVLYANDLLPLPFDPAWLAGAPTPERARPLEPRLLYVLRAWRAGRRVPRRWHEAPFNYLPAVPDPRNPWSAERSAAELARFVPEDLARAMRAGRFNPALARWFPWAREALRRPVDWTPHLAALADFAQSREVRLLVVYIPTKSQVSDRYLAHQARYSPPGSALRLSGGEWQGHARGLARSCAALDLPFLDLGPELRAREAAGPELFWSYDDHLRSRGYRALAEVVFAWWKGLTPQAP
jgi:hypothetical protein